MFLVVFEMSMNQNQKGVHITFISLSFYGVDSTAVSARR